MQRRISSKQAMRCIDHVWAVVSAPRRHWRFIQVLRSAASSGLVEVRLHSWQSPEFPVKLFRAYMSLKLNTSQRREAIISHYEFLSRRYNRQFSAKSSFLSKVIWDFSKCGSPRLTVSIEQSTLCALEGELTLSFLMDGATLFFLTFSIVSGQSIGLNLDQVLLIGGVQGIPNARQAIRAASKAAGEIAPLDLLLLAVRAVADALDVTHLAGIATDCQVCCAPTKVSFNYDALWLTQEGLLTSTGFYLFARDAKEKPLEAIPQTHRARTRKKRLLKSKIRNEMTETIRRLFFAQTVYGPSPSRMMTPKYEPLA